MRILCATLILALSACGNGPGTATARWVGGGVDESVTGTARGGWCAEASTLLLEIQSDDRVAGVTWHFDSLAPGTYRIAPADPSDTLPPVAAVAARYVHLDEVRGYRGLSGTLTVSAVDSTRISAGAEAALQRVGEADTLRFTATFTKIPLTRDETLCRR